MAKKLSIPVNPADEYTVIAISCHLKDYRISFYLNNSLGIKLKRARDLIIETQAGENHMNYALYAFDDQDYRSNIYLLANHHPDGKLLSSQKQSDYFLIFTPAVIAKDLDNIILNIRQIQGVLTAYNMNLRKAMEVDLLLTDLEMHLMND